MSDVPAWTRPGHKALPRSIEIIDRRLHEHANLRSGTSRISSEDQLDSEPTSTDTADY
jgi:hypothetical protein